MRVYGVLLLSVCLSLCAACSCESRITRGGDGGTTDSARADVPTPDAPSGDGNMQRNCAQEARWVYVIDAGRQLLRFEPDSLTLTPIGTVNCPSMLGATPFSMAVDRDATAWVLHQDSRLYQVSTADASCTATTFQPNQQGFELFGMGYVADTDGSEEETLFIAGGSAMSIATGSAQLGSIDSGLTASRIGNLPGWPELTGTGTGQLWGFFPDTQPSSVRQLDKVSGMTVQNFDLNALGAARPSAWAFAFWGARFYVFLQRETDASTNIWRLDPADGSFVEVVSDTGLRIVGAGVSTCAPTVLI